jgi:hypothetical protein
VTPADYAIVLEDVAAEAREVGHRCEGDVQQAFQTFAALLDRRATQFRDEALLRAE